LTIALPALPIGAGAIAAPAAVAMPNANAKPKAIVFMIMQLSPFVRTVPNAPEARLESAREDASIRRAKINLHVLN